MDHDIGHNKKAPSFHI